MSPPPITIIQGKKQLQRYHDEEKFLELSVDSLDFRVKQKKVNRKRNYEVMDQDGNMDETETATLTIHDVSLIENPDDLMLPRNEDTISHESGPIQSELSKIREAVNQLTISENRLELDHLTELNDAASLLNNLRTSVADSVDFDDLKNQISKAADLGKLSY